MGTRFWKGKQQPEPSTKQGWGHWGDSSQRTVRSKPHWVQTSQVQGVIRSVDVARRVQMGGNGSQTPNKRHDSSHHRRAGGRITTSCTAWCIWSTALQQLSWTPSMTVKAPQQTSIFGSRRSVGTAQEHHGPSVGPTITDVEGGPDPQ